MTGIQLLDLQDAERRFFRRITTEHPNPEERARVLTVLKILLHPAHRKMDRKGEPINYDALLKEARRLAKVPEPQVPVPKQISLAHNHTPSMLQRFLSQFGLDRVFSRNRA